MALNGSFDRSRFKGASLNANKALVEETQNKTQIQYDSTRPNFLDIKEGKNVFRVAPPHNPEDPSLQPFRRTWVSVFVDEEKDGQKTGKQVSKKRVVWDSRVHGDTPKDLIEEYINLVYKKIYDECQSKEEREKLLYPITGYRKEGKWIPGLRPSTSYVLYAWKEGKLGRLEITPYIQKRMEELNINDESDSPITTDCFSDPDQGFNLIIEYDKNAKQGERYKVNRGMTPSSLTDDQLQELASQDSLSEIYRGAYKHSDFLLALEGLQNFDTENEYNIFQMDEWEALVQEISSYYPEEESEEETQTEQSESEEETEVESEEIDLKKMNRAQLKAFVVEKELDIVVKPSISDTQLRELILSELSSQTEQTEVKEEKPKNSVVNLGQMDQEINKEVQDKLDQKSSSIPLSLKDRMAQLKAKSKN